MRWPDAIVSRATAELGALYGKTGAGLSVEERARIIAGLHAEYLEAERLEEMLVRCAEDRGEIVWRRPRESPAAVLGVIQKA
ncbi:hypothetical protein [Bradyrhizobium lablabi]|uniref:hypothetical protein n=1 Tax=Bradyrhizobium lablabi TaxID=722472 RepID=UPI001BA8C041|nr:hypothetical protein [Bradyrhizobium lablabi]MBR0696591.1 hypothetical protein [Bradyrhizobium lablabi]